MLPNIVNMLNDRSFLLIVDSVCERISPKCSSFGEKIKFSFQYCGITLSWPGGISVSTRLILAQNAEDTESF